MLNLQETKALFEKAEYKDIKSGYDAMREQGYFDYDELNLFGKGWLQEEQRITPMGQDDANKLKETIDKIPLRHLLKEFLAKSSTTGLSGAAYLIPSKIYQTLYTYAAARDIINDVGPVLPADEIPGATVDVDIAVGASYVPHYISSGGKIVDEDIKFTKATLDFTMPWGIHFNIGNDLIEDSKFNLIETHVRMAGEQMGKYSTTQILAVMANTTDGDGTLNTSAATEDAATLTELRNAMETVIADEFIPDRFICPSEMFASMALDVTVSAYANEAHNKALLFQDPGWFGLKWVRCDHPSLWTETSHAPTDCIAYIYCYNYSYLSGRKRWLRLEHYSDPVRDLVGATITARQDTISCYNDSVCKLSE